MRLAQFDPGADDEASLEFAARPIEFGGPFDRAEETGALIAGMQIEMIGYADFRQALLDRAETLLDDRLLCNRMRNGNADDNRVDT